MSLLEEKKGGGSSPKKSGSINMKMLSDGRKIMPKPINMAENKLKSIKNKPKNITADKGKTLKKAVEDSAPAAQESCTHWYGGIGIMSTIKNNNTQEVFDVSPGYPADKAGIQVGDVITPSEEIRGEPGTVITIIVRRYGQELKLNITREKICTN